MTISACLPMLLTGPLLMLRLSGLADASRVLAWEVRLETADKQPSISDLT